MQISFWVLILASLTEVFLLVGLIVFFLRLRRSEATLNTLQANQEKLLTQLHVNAELEQELMDSFARRQAELQALDRKLEELVRAGFPDERVVIDPGIGFGKKLEHNLALLKHIDRFYSLGRPVLVGISYKSFLGGLTGAALERRGGLTLAASALLAQRGVWAHRVHDVAAVKEALELAHSLAGVE